MTAGSLGVFFRRAPLIVILAAQAYAVQLENWRQPYYEWAARMGLARSSPSGMFWDNIDGAAVFAPSLWPDSARHAQNHWTLEPRVSGGYVSPKTTGWDQPAWWHLDLLNDIRFRNLLVRQALDADLRYNYDGERYPAHRDRFARGRLEEAYAQLDWKYGLFRIGRLARNWGPFADRSLLLSANPYSYDAVEWGVHSTLFEFRHLFAAFPLERSYLDTDGRGVNRYLSAHALNVMLGNRVTLGIFESALIPRPDGLPDFAYVNPISSYTVINTNQEGTANVMLGFQARIRPFTDRVTLKGQLALDDIQVDDSLVTDQEPNHWGLDIGAFWNDPVSLRWLNVARIEYTRSSPWLYTVPDANTAQGERYTLFRRSLGYGTVDGDRVAAGFTVTGPDFWGADLTLAYRRQGAKTVEGWWGDSSSPDSLKGVPPEFRDYTFPTGVVERRVEAGLTAMVYLSDYADLRVGIDNRWIRNRDNKETGGFEYSPRFHLEASAHFCDFFFMMPE